MANGDQSPGNEFTPTGGSGGIKPNEKKMTKRLTMRRRPAERGGGVF